MQNEFLIEGKNALSAGEWEKARNLLEKALKYKVSAEVYEELGWACWWLNDGKAVFENRTKAYKLFLENNNKLGASRNAGWLGLDYIEFKGEFAVASGWFQRSESLLEGLPDSVELALIKVLKARWAFQVEKNPEAAFKLLEESMNISKSFNNIDVEMLAEALKGFILVVEGSISEGMQFLDEAALIAMTSQKSDIKITTVACCFLIDACERIRDFERALQWCNNVKELSKKWNYKAMFANCKMKYAGVLILKGDWESAEEELLSASSELKEFRPVQVNACSVRLADLKRRQGKWKEAEEILNSVESHPLKSLYLAELYFDRGEYEKSLTQAEKYIRRFSDNEKTERTIVIELLIRIYCKLEKLEKARVMENELRDTVSAINTLPLRAALLSAEGNINFACSNNEFAKQNYEDTVDMYEKIKLPYESSRNRLNLSEILIKLNKHAQAEGELNEAISKFKYLGAEKDFEKASRILNNLYKGNAGKTGTIPLEFTGRELEVLRLIADGINNEEIAEKFFLSVRTVEKHLTNIYSKLGISGKSARAYAASYAVKHKLIFD